MQLSAGSSDLQVAAEDLIGLMERSGTALALVARRLDEEFATRFKDAGVNPLEIIKRIKRLERELPELKDQCQALISTKQARQPPPPTSAPALGARTALELTDAARQLLRGNRDQLQALVARSGAPPHGAAAAAGALGAALEEWDAQMRRAREGEAGGGLDYDARELNLALARSNLQ
ncbi:MAG: hypothetical protein J3K34DRAFT_470752 [Monoraphidium minutum]|nr:MAG: hypothetical protein J3K34DRAFT_470752 [Monoraphidium minutum]